MSSSPRADLTRLRSPRTWSLRTRLLVTQVALLAVVCAVIGVATEFALQRFLMHQLDQQVVEAGRRSATIFDLPPPPPRLPGFPNRERFDPEIGPGPGFLGAPGQSTRTVGAVISHGVTVDAGVVTADGTRAEVSPLAADQLARIRPNHRVSTVDLDGLGRYRLIAMHPRGGDETIVTGLPLSDVDDTLWWVLVMFCVVGVIALIAATTAGILIIRRQLEPLSRVSAAARQVADLELDRGEVRLPTPIVKVDPAGAHTEVGQLGSALNRMLDRIAGALSARHASETRVRQFVADASHELRTPLAAIRGYTELAQRKRDDVHGSTPVGRSNASPSICPDWSSTRSAMPTSPGLTMSGRWICPTSRLSCAGTKPGCIRCLRTCSPTREYTPPPAPRSPRRCPSIIRALRC
jgi:two-component system, OmpR family, sensor kinase